LAHEHRTPRGAGCLLRAHRSVHGHGRHGLRGDAIRPARDANHSGPSDRCRASAREDAETPPAKLSAVETAHAPDAQQTLSPPVAGPVPSRSCGPNPSLLRSGALRGRDQNQYPRPRKAPPTLAGARRLPDPVCTPHRDPAVTALACCQSSVAGSLRRKHRWSGSAVSGAKPARSLWMAAMVSYLASDAAAWAW
jgi:hypothetical protein